MSALLVRLSNQRASFQVMKRCNLQQFRVLAIYAVGEGWTCALTRTHILESIPGHFDEDTGSTMDCPVKIYPNNDVQQAAVGWGCSAFLDTQGQVHLVGRPHDLSTLLRLNRLPRRIRQWANQHSDPSESTIVGSMISNLIGWASGGDEEETWGVARQYSLLHDWTKVDVGLVGDSKISQIACSAGFMAIIGGSGTLYTMGINNRGQCGTGEVSNNIWTPQSVTGITGSSKKAKDGTEQDHPIVQVALGFQHGYALTEQGQVYSWGKGNRGQLGRELQSDQEATARIIHLDEAVTRIASGMHHGALLTSCNKVYIWGKNMGKTIDSKSDQTTLADARIPELVNGLPEGKKVINVSCGSHHTSILLEDGSVFALGIASDEAVPLLNPVQLVSPGTLQFPLRHFEAHHDRTTVIDGRGQVIQAHLWKDKKLREYSLFTPSYVDALLDEGQSIEAIHRGWVHTIIVTKPVAT